MHNLALQVDDDSEQFIAECVEQAASRVAPTWPLDQFIAVNPYWGWSDESFSVVAKEMWKLAGAPLTMSREYFQQNWQHGQFGATNLQAAIDYAEQKISLVELQNAMQTEHALSRPVNLVTQLVDLQRDLSHAAAWQQFVKHQISQHCASHFDQGQASWHPGSDTSLYSAWLQHTAYDQGPLLQLGFKQFESEIKQLPTSASALINMVLPRIGLGEEHWASYLCALLIDINGWAAWCSYLKWQAQLEGGQSDQLRELLAIRLAWEWLLIQRHPKVRTDFNAAWKNANANDAAIQSQCSRNEMLLHAMEHAYQQPLSQELLAVKSIEQRIPDFQAVFCIDVRSEVYRRSLEASDPNFDTLGFAGFFGLPIAYKKRGTALNQPQLPGLLAPKYWVSEIASDADSAVQSALRDKTRWQAMKKNASSAFTFVETLGLLYGSKLLGQTRAAQRFSLRANREAGRHKHEEAALALYTDASLGMPVSLAEQASLAKQILIAMGLQQNFARLVLLVGHGTACVNNPHAAGLDCGACGGQNGAINVRMLTSMLNNAELRRLLEADGINIPHSTWFVAGLHNTTTDDIELFNLGAMPPTHRDDLVRLHATLSAATKKTRTERAASLGIDARALQPQQSQAAFAIRATDWAQIRPEWGLANNAAFIVAPRQRSRAKNLQGRVFLHDYQWQQDTTFAILELIMTAPMIVTNWINMQYYASSVDPERYGSGSKILHNVVGQRLGVFEGNGGDLRIGLPWQSVHNGEHLMHTPLRLSVYIEAPQNEIDAIIEKHAVVRQLVDNRWLHLFQISDDENKIYYRHQQKWTLFADGVKSAGPN